MPNGLKLDKAADKGRDEWKTSTFKSFGEWIRFTINFLQKYMYLHLLKPNH